MGAMNLNDFTGTVCNTWKKNGCILFKLTLCTYLKNFSNILSNNKKREILKFYVRLNRFKIMLIRNFN